MRVLSIGTDRKMFEKNSGVFLRSMEYASKMQELHIVVFSLKSQGLKQFRKDNLYIYPTNSFSRFYYIIDAIRLGNKIIKKHEFSINSSVITCQDPFETGLVGVLIKRKFHLPMQIQIHTDFLSQYFNKGVLNRIRIVISKFTLPKADGIRVVSSIIKDSLLCNFKNLKAKIDVLPIFVDIEKIIERQDNFSGSERVKNSILMISRFAKEKRIEVGLEVLKNVIDKGYKEVFLSIVGDGPEKSNIQKKIQDLNLETNVKILEWDNDVMSLYKKADIFLLTSEFEGYGMTLIEAGASGCSIVTTEVGVAKTELFKDGLNSYVCPVGDIECISNKIIDLITNEEKRKSFVINMRDSIKSISLEREEYILKYISLLEKIIKS